jgi:hypothetical protein
MKRREIDDHPGPLPQIRATGKSVTFEFDPGRGSEGARLVIRCDENGEVFAKITLPEIKRRQD